MANEWKLRKKYRFVIFANRATLKIPRSFEIPWPV